MAIPETCNDRASGIWRKINPQRQAKGEISAMQDVSPMAAVFISLFLIFLRCCPLPDRAANAIWVMKMVPLSLERGRLGL
jgi:hypothetical protein